MATAYIDARPSNSLIQAARQTMTRQWWDGGRSGLELFTSLETLDEIGRGEPRMAVARLQLIKDLPILEVTDQVASLAKKLVMHGLIPPKAASDAIHIAVACVHEIDFLITWNFRHIANALLRHRLRQEIVDFGAKLSVICTPEELISHESD